MTPRTAVAAVSAVVVAALIALPASAAHAAGGSLSDPKGDGDPDIVSLTYANKPKAVRMSMTYADIALAQNESFYLRWGAGKSYQLFSSDSAGIRELRYYSSKSALPKVVRCSGLTVTHQTAQDRTRVKIPRTCLAHAPKKLKFQGIATMGLSSSDQTKVTGKIAQG
jgi:hypothetical protein